MAQPKKKTSKTKTGKRRSHLIAKLRRAVNKTSPVRAVAQKPAVKAKTSPAKRRSAKKAAPAKKSGAAAKSKK